MSSQEKAESLAKRIDKIDQLNEVALGEEAVVGVEGEEKITQKIGTLKANEKQKNKILDEQEAELEKIANPTDNTLNIFIKKSLDRLDSMNENRDTPDEYEKRKTLVNKWFSEKLGGFVAAINENPALYENGAGYYLAQVAELLEEDFAFKKMNNILYDYKADVLDNIVAIMQRTGGPIPGCTYILNTLKLSKKPIDEVLSDLGRNAKGIKTGEEIGSKVDYVDEFAYIADSMVVQCEKFNIPLPNDLRQFARDIYEATRGERSPTSVWLRS